MMTLIFSEAPYPIRFLKIHIKEHFFYYFSIKAFDLSGVNEKIIKYVKLF